MLVLTRKLGQSMMIGDGIVITVTSIAQGKVKLGIQAPADVRILRSELTENQCDFNQSLNRQSNRKVFAPVDRDASYALDHGVIDFTTDYAAEIEDQLLLTAIG